VRFTHRIFLLATLAVLVFLGGCEAKEEVLLADGSSTQFSQWDGHWVLVNYWAEWCAPCRKEIPDLNRLHNERASNGVVVVGVNYDGLKGEKLKSLAVEMNIDFPVLVEDPRLRWEQDSPSVLPTTFVIDPTGNLHEVLIGPHSYESFSAALNITTEL